MMERYHLEDLGLEGMVILNWISKKWSKWIGLIWLRIGTGGELLRMR
jgi:hypothetical protein